MHYFVGQIVSWAERYEPPAGFVRVTLPVEHPGITPVVQIMYVGEAAAEAVGAALQWARLAERELILDAVSRVCTSDQCDAIAAEINSPTTSTAAVPYPSPASR